MNAPATSRWTRIFLLISLARVLASGPLWASTPETTFGYDVPSAGKVSLAIYDAAGRMVRPVFYGQPHDAGTHEATWDGLDRYGAGLPAGKYQWRLLQTPGFSRELLINLGVNHPWSPFDLWPGNHTGPTLVYVDPQNALYVGAHISEGPPHLVKLAPGGGRKLWDDGTYGSGTFDNGPLGVAVIDDVLYMLGAGTLSITARRADSYSPLKNNPRISVLHAGDAAQDRPPTSFAGGSDFLVIGYQNHNQLRFVTPVLDTMSGKLSLAKDVSVSVPALGAIAVAADDRVFAVSGSNVVKVDRSGKVTTVLADVPSPGALAYDSFHDDFLVVSGGQCIRRYHSDGKQVAVHGDPKGRTYGAFNPLDFDAILSIACDAKGGFYTAEQFPRRVAHFSGRQQLAVEDQWFGGMAWGASATLDPQDTSIAYLPLDDMHIACGKVDYSNQTWTVTHVFPLVDHASWGAGKDLHSDILPGGRFTYWEVRHIGKETFLLSRGRAPNQLGYVTVLRLDESRNALLPVACLGCVKYGTPQLPAWWLAALRLPPTASLQQAGGTKHLCFSWSDKNENGLVDQSEIKTASVGYQFADQARAVDQDWNITLVADVNGQIAVATIPNEGTPTAPAWNWDRWRTRRLGLSAAEQANLSFSAHSTRGVWSTEDGSVFTSANNSTNQPADQADAPPLTWPNNKYHSSRLLKVDAKGKELFSVGLHTDSKARLPGVFSDLRAILGSAGDNIVVMDACSPASVWTSDGLYAGSFLDDTGYSPAADPPRWQTLSYGPQKIVDRYGSAIITTTIDDDSQWGQVIHAANGDLIWGQMGVNNTPFYRIQGFDGWRRQQGDIALAKPSKPAEAKGSGLKAEFFSTADLSGNALSQTECPQIAFGAMGANHLFVKSWPSWPKGVLKGAFSARWTGVLEGPLSETFALRVYTSGDQKNNGARVRVWANDELILDQWSQINLAAVARPRNTVAYDSKPVRFVAGEKLPIKIEFAAADDPDAHLHLYWSSPSFDLRHVPRNYLYK
jgi:hypothetical protein